MNVHEVSNLGDGELIRNLTALVARERRVTVEMLVYLAEVFERRLYLPSGYSSMYLFCVGEFRMSEEAAFKRIRVARMARQYPAILDAINDGRLHMSAVVLLASRLTSSNASDLLSAAANKSKSEIELMLAERFPRPDVPAVVAPVPCVKTHGRESGPLSPGTVFPRDTKPDLPQANMIVASPAGPSAVESRPTEPHPKIAPLAPQRYAMQLTIGQSTHDKLRYAQQLLRHQNPSGDLASVIDQALDALITKLEKRKFAATDAPQSKSRPTTSARHVPSHVKRAVLERDGGRCTFVGETGHRCGTREFLEFDHVDAVARGGIATTDGIRLRCRAHNQYEAECTFGKAFMENKRPAAGGSV